jgi:hypothetical protein
MTRMQMGGFKDKDGPDNFKNRVSFVQCVMTPLLT